MSKIYGYIRVSYTEQKEDRQLIALSTLGIRHNHLMIDKQSEKGFQRKKKKKLLKKLYPGDLFYILSIDRLGRNYEEIQNQWRLLTKELGVDICAVDMPILDTRNRKDLVGEPLADLVLQILSFVAHNEREIIRKRQAEGIAASKEKGVRFRPPEISTPEDFPIIVSSWESKQILFSEAVLQSGLSEATFYRCLRVLRKTN